MERCINCFNPISTYPCKYCGAGTVIDDICPRLKGATCVVNKKICKNPREWMNCGVLRGKKM